METLPYGHFKNLTNLDLGKNKVMNVSTIARLPNKLVELDVDLNENPSADYFQHLTKLKTLYINSKVVLNYHSLSQLQTLENLQVTYETPASQVLNITLEGCPVSLSKVHVTIGGGDVDSFENKCPNVSEIFLINKKPCDCGVFNQLKTGVGGYLNSFIFSFFC